MTGINSPILKRALKAKAEYREKLKLVIVTYKEIEGLTIAEKLIPQGSD